MGPFNYTCQCAPSYTGSACEDVIDGCLEITCPNNSVCVNGSLCVCLPGFELTGGVCAQTPSTDKPTGIYMCNIIMHSLTNNTAYVTDSEYCVTSEMVTKSTKDTTCGSKNYFSYRFPVLGPKLHWVCL